MCDVRTVQHVPFHSVICPSADPMTHSCSPKGDTQVATTPFALTPALPYNAILKMLEVINFPFCFHQLLSHLFIYSFFLLFHSINFT